jgi:VWFA-related protein
MRRTRLGIVCLLWIAGIMADAQTFRERINVELVRVELLVIDGQRQPVHGLRPEQIHVLVDGRAVSLESFEEPSVLPRLPAASQLPLPAAPLTSAIPEAPGASPNRRLYSMAILVDETSSEQSNRQAVLRDLFQFLEAPLAPDVEVLLMRFDGTLRVECPWTADVERLRRAAAAISRHRVASALGMPGQLSDNPEQGGFKLELEAMEAVGRVRTSLAGLFDALREFPEKPGRKALYFVTDGAPFLTPPEIARDLIATSPSTGGSGAVPRAGHEGDYDRDLLVDSLAWSRTKSQSLLTDITRLALLRGIEIHPVRSAPHDLDGRVRTDRGFHERATVAGGRPPDLRSLRNAATLPMTDIAAGQGMEAAAEATGGEAVLSRRMFQDDLRREVSSRDAAYVLAFRDPFAGDHHFHRIEISLERKGLDLRYRRGYRVLDTRESLIEGAVDRLHVPADRNPLGVRLQLDSAGEENGLPVARITVAYPAPPEAGGSVSAAGSVSIIGMCAVRDGALSQPIDLSGKADRASLADSTWLVRSGRVRLKPGAYRWSFAIRDEQTGITSYLTFDRKLP